MKSILLALLCILGLGSGSAAAEDAAPTPFVGRIVFTRTAAGDREGAKTFRGLAASKIVVYFGRAACRQDENGGINKGSVITRDGARTALRLDHDRKQSERGGDWVSSYGFCRVAYRGRRQATKPKSTIGFRIVCEAVVGKDPK